MTSSIALALSLATQPASPADIASDPAASVTGADADAERFEPEGPAPAPALAPASAPAPGASRPPEPRWRGTGLIAAAGVFGGIGFAANLGRVITASRLCQQLRFDAETQSVAGINECAFGSAALGVLAPIALFSNITAFGLSAGAGVNRGRWAAHSTAFAGARQQNSNLQIGLGAGIMAAGIITYIGARIGSYADLLGFDSCNERYPLVDVTAENEPSADSVRGNIPEFRKCMGRSMAGYLAGIGIGQTMGVVGVGLLTHGVTYRRNLKLMQYITRNQIRLAPTLSFNYAGLSLSGRF
jgi:hypothetical protein